MRTKTATTTRKATHQGTCQICGANQKLPAGVLSIHGYTTRWGFFSGICGGSRHLPFEQNKDLIASQIAWAEATAEGLDAEAAELIAGKLNDDGTAWFGIYSNRSAQREYELVTIHRQEGVGVPTFTYTRTQYPSDRDRHERINHAYISSVPGERSLDDVRRAFNATYASNRLQPRAAELRRYAAWQRERIANWKPQPLKPISK